MVDLETRDAENDAGNSVSFDDSDGDGGGTGESGCDGCG
jgi:hypothetical protein